MTKKKAILTAVVLLLIGGLYYYFYGDAFKKPVIHISHTIRPGGVRRRAGRAAETQLLPTFALNGEYQLTSIRVVAVDDLKTSKFPHPLWELMAETKPVSARLFTYGIQLRGMQPKMPGTQPEPLATNVAYRLYVEAGRVKGEHDFTIPGQEAPAQPPQ